MGLSWALFDLRGPMIGPLTDRRPGGKVTVELNGKRTASLTLSLRDPFAGAVYADATVLKVALDGELIFAGVIQTPRYAGRDGTVELNAVDPSFQLEQPCPANPDFLPPAGDGSWFFSGAQADVMWALGNTIRPTAAELAAGVPDIPIVHGSFGAPVLRVRTYPEGKQVWEAWVEMSQVLDGPDFELAPMKRTDGYLVQLNTYERQGTDRSGSVSLEFNVGKGNAGDFKWEPPGERVVNRATVVGYSDDPATTVPRDVADNFESQYTFGIRRSREGRSDVFEQETVTEIAQRTVAEQAWPADIFTVSPAIEGRWYDRDAQTWETGYGIPPRFGPSGPGPRYWIGDTIRAIARVLPGLDFNGTGRVSAATITEVDAAANVQADITFQPLITAAGVS